MPAAWARPLEEYETYRRAGGRSSHTQTLATSYLGRLAQQVAPAGPWDVTSTQLLSFLARDGWKPSTRKSARSAIRCFYSWAAEFEYVSSNPARRLPEVHVPATLPRPAPDSALRRALDGAKPREQLMVLLAAYAGLRRTEIATLHAGDILEDALRVTGKGGRTREIPIGEGLAVELVAAASAGGWVFPGQVDGHLSPNQVGVLLKRLLGAGWTAHTLRHRFASRAYAGTRDLLAVQTLLGHSKPETTRQYVAIPDGFLRAAVQAAGPLMEVGRSGPSLGELADAGDVAEWDQLGVA